jgi:hypothetical protein
LSAKIIEFPVLDDPGAGVTQPPQLTGPLDDAIEQIQDLAGDTRWLIREIRFAKIKLPIDVEIRLQDLARRVGA